MSTIPYAAGAGPAGHAPVAAPSAAAQHEGPVAMRYDGATRDWLVENGIYRSVHPVDQGVALSMCVRQGDLTSSPTTGNLLHKIDDLSSKDLKSKLEDTVKRSNPLARYLADGSVVIERIEYSAPPLKVALFYRNTKLDPNRVLRRDSAT